MSEEITRSSRIKHISMFKRISDTPENFYNEDILSLSELINILVIYQANNSDDKYYDIDATFRGYHKLFIDGINSGHLQVVNGVSKKTTPILSQFVDIMGGCTELIMQLVANIYSAKFTRIKIRDLDKCVKTYDAIIFCIKNKIEVPDLFVDFVIHHKPDAIKLETLKRGDEEVILCSLVDEPTVDFSEQPRIIENRISQEDKTTEHAPSREYVPCGNNLSEIAIEIAKKEAIKQIRSETGKRKGEKWRTFVSSNLKPMVERELKEGCFCLHRDMAGRLKDEVINEARMSLGDKFCNQKKDNHPSKIEDEIKYIFYQFSSNYSNVRSRVFRGKYYNEYDHVPCPLHSGK